MSELIQEEKYISYDNFIPNWTELIKEMDEIGVEGSLSIRIDYAYEKGYGFSDCSQCLVGEGHRGKDYYVGFGFDGKYGDKECGICTSMCAMPASEAILGGKEFNSFKRTFYNHMIKEHQDLMVKRN